MYSEALRPGRTLGSYPERDAPADTRLDELAQRALGTFARRGLLTGYAARRFLARVNALGETLPALGAHELSVRTRELRQQLMLQGMQNELTAQAFALVREVAQRTLGMRHYDEQVIGGWVMLNGMLAEMETGEGKTLTATLPACVAALAGIPVHVITVNDYLVARDAELMAPIYNVLGLSVGTVLEAQPDPRVRKAAYASDVTYCTNKQLAFDYLRDRLTMGHRRGPLHRQLDYLRRRRDGGKDLLLRGLCFGIVDEADSVLIDEARTPLILSREIEQPFAASVYRDALDMAAQLSAGDDYAVLEQEREVVLNATGKVRMAELVEGRSEFWSRPRRRESLVQQALCAQLIYKKDDHYLVMDDKVQIIDQNTGRLMPDRSWEMGLHQMIEAKELCEITPARESLARITYQEFFSRYLRLGAMSGTATEVAGELWLVYGLRVHRVPTHKPLQRVAMPTHMHATQDAKWQDVVARVRKLHALQRPILIGTRSVAASEHISALLTAAALPHQVLNARQDQHEADVVARAGQAGRITVATNMAGRGTDIPLSAGVAELGGLHVLATERNEARRIDRQLYGRCARQGEPGSYEAILSLEDDIIMFCALGPVITWIRSIKSPNLERSAWIGPALVRLAQRRLERRHARIRRALLRRDRGAGDRLAFTGPME